MSAQVEIQSASSAAATDVRTLKSETRTASHEGGYRLKRVFDVVFSLGVIVLGAPVYAILALAIRLTSPGPVLYRQERIGRNGERFDCLKFRTMVQDAEARLEELLASCPNSREEFERCFKLKDDPRITRTGRFLRRTSLDELPQFWNVIRGEMSVVGPRPVVDDELDRYGGHAEDYLSVRPGITGIWQVSGRNHTTYRERVAMDTAYARDHRFLEDVATILRTVVVMVQRHRAGAY